MERWDWSRHVLSVLLPWFLLEHFLCCHSASTVIAAAAKPLQSCPTLCDPVDGSPPGSCPWDSPGKNTGVGCLFLLQCMKVKSESEVTQSFWLLPTPWTCSLPGLSVHGIFQARVLEWGAIAFSNCHSYTQARAFCSFQRASLQLITPNSKACYYYWEVIANRINMNVLFYFRNSITETFYLANMMCL